MPEATLICVDNSEWVRNGDYTPDRFRAQVDAVNLVIQSKSNAHIENTLALLSYATETPKVHATLTTDVAKLLTALSSVKVGGQPKFMAGIQVAQLALKHRMEKNQRQRIIAFVASPIAESAELLVALARKLKKNNVSVDVISFGEEQSNAAKLEAFVNAVNSGDSSHLFTVPPGPHLLSDVLLTSPILADESGMPPAAVVTRGEGGNLDFVDPNMDPELALAIRMSLEEERARQAAQTTTGSASFSADAATPSGASAAAPSSSGAMEIDSALAAAEDDELQRALALSMQSDDASAASSAASAGAPAGAPAGAASTDLIGLLANITGVDANDPEIQEAVRKLQQQQKDEKK